MVPLRLVTDYECASVWGDPMIVVAADREARVDCLRHSTGRRYAIYSSPAVVDQRLSIAEPIWRFNSRWSYVCNASIRRVDSLRFERTVKERRPAARCKRRDEFNVRERRLLDRVLVVRADPKADVKGLFKRDLRSSSGKLQVIATG